MVRTGGRQAAFDVDLQRQSRVGKRQLVVSGAGYRLSSFRSSFDLPGHVEFDHQLRIVSAIVNDQVPAYAELDLRWAWMPVPSVELSLNGRNLLARAHAEFSPPASRQAIERHAYAKMTWRF